VDDEVGVHVADGAADLSYEERSPVQRQAHLSLGLVQVEVFVDVLVSGVLANQVDELVISEEPVELGDVGVVHEGVDFNLAENVLLDL
jgi:hypothetical protein